ncbi:MAG: sll1863 family stress response protein [Pirellulales bacterium]
MSRLVWMLMLAGSFAALGCEQKPGDPAAKKVTSEDVRRDAGQAAKTAVEYSQQSKEEFQKKLEAQLKELDGKIAALRAKGRNLKDKAKTDWDQKMAELQTKREAASAKLTEAGHASAEAWKDVKKGAQSAYDDLDRAFRNASQEF